MVLHYRIIPTVGFLIGAAVLCLYKIETDLKTVSAVSCNFYGIGHKELFQSVTYPDTVSKWFRWISDFRAADCKPMGVGKQYVTFFNDQSLIFRVTEYEPDHLVVLESESLLRPRLELRTFAVSSKASRLVICLAFRRSSALFQMSVGPILQEVSRQRIQEAVKNLKRMLRHRAEFNNFLPDLYSIT